MRPELPLYQYQDACHLLCWDRDSLNGVIIDKKSEEVMHRIEQTMSRLKVMGDDVRRYFWIWAQKSNKEREWLQVMCAHYQDFHYLALSDGVFRNALFKNSDNIRSKKSDEGYDLKAPLLALEKHVEAVVDWICESPSEYNAYVERYLPYHKRSGDIPRRVLHTLLPDSDLGIDNDRLIAGLEEIKSATPTPYEEITLNIYIAIWTACYRVIARLRANEEGSDMFDNNRLGHANTMSDVELFKHYNNKGYRIDGLDLDSVDDYKKWYYENYPYHCMDVSYARIHLNPWKENNELCYHFHLNFGVYGYYLEVAEIAIALYRQGIVLEIDEMESLLRILKQEDMVGFRPWPDKYMDRDGVTNQVWLPRIGDISKEVYWKIIKNTQWHNQEPALPM